MLAPLARLAALACQAALTCKTALARPTRPSGQARMMAGLLVGLSLGVLASSASWLAEPAAAAIGDVCPVPTGEVTEGIKVCTDRGEGATYQAGDRITVCVSANIPQIAIYPPPPPPTIRVENVAADGSTRQLIEAQMTDGQECVTGSIVEPFGQESVHAQAVSQDGSTFQEDSVSYTTVAQ